MPTTDDDVLADLARLADDLGLRRRVHGLPDEPDEAMLVAVLAEHRRGPAHRRRWAVVAAAASVVVVAGGLLWSADDERGDPADVRVVAASVSLDPLLDPPALTADPGVDQASGETTDFAADRHTTSLEQEPVRDAEPLRGSGGVFRSSCTACRHPVGPVDTVVLVGGVRTGSAGDRATVVRTFRGSAAKGQRIVIRRDVPALALPPGLGERRMVYFLRTVGHGVYSNAAASYVEGRPGRYVTGWIVPKAPVEQFSVDDLELATGTD